MTEQDLSLNYQSLQARNAKHHIHPFTATEVIREEGARIADRAEGCYIYDTDGRKILDGMAGLWNVNIGHGRKEIAAAVAAQMDKMAYYNTFFKSSHSPAIDLSEKLAEICPGPINRFSFTCSGSEGNDTAYRMIRSYWIRKGQPQRRAMISRRYAYHGSTVGGASLGHTGLMHRDGGLPIPDIHHIMPPYSYEYGNGMSEEEFGEFAARQVEIAIDSIGAERVAAFFGEPIQGGGGLIIPPKNYWPLVEKICRDRDVLLVADEVICGFGRTGKWFGCEQMGFTPDIMVMAKGITSGYLPLGAVGYADHVAEDLFDKGGAVWHGFTYASHPTCCAAALANIEIMQKEKIVEYVEATAAPYLKTKWLELANHPLVAEARMEGLLGALEIDVKRANPQSQYAKPDFGGGAAYSAPQMGAGLVSDYAYELGLIARPIKDVLVISPPLVINLAEMDELIAHTKAALDRALATVQNG